MNAIFKYPLVPFGHFVTVLMPRGARVLHVHEQNDEVTLWALVYSPVDKVERVFAIRSTGELVEDNLEYLGTAHCGSFVRHVFEVLP
jgi:hypothetical protein